MKKIKAWAIINRQNDLTNKQAEHFQLYTFKEKNPAQYLAWLWNKQSGKKKYRVVPCAITYKL